MTPSSRRSFLTATAGGLAALALPRPAAARGPALDPDTLFLTYAGDPTTSVRVQWVHPADHAVAPAVHVAPLDSADWRAVPTTVAKYPLTDLNRFRADVTGLTPGREYQLTLGDGAPVYRFRTCPAKATDTFSFVSGGDCGVNPHAVANNRVAARQDPHFALVGGDLGYDNGRSVEVSLGFVRNWSRTMTDTQGRLIPMVVCLGNHEVDGGYLGGRAKAPFFFSLHDGLFAEASYATLDVGDYLSLVLLDTNHVSPVAGEQTSWLDAQLKAREDRPHLFCVDHVPCYPSYRPFEGENGQAGTGEDQRRHWCPLFERYNVDLVLEHHDHTFKRTHRLKDGLKDANGILYLGDGSWGMLRVPKTPEQRPYLAAVSPSYHLTLHRLEGERRFHLALEESGRILDITTTEKKLPRRRG